MIKPIRLDSGIDIVETLRLLDAALMVQTDAVCLCGSAVPILAGCKFRATQDIDFAVLPPDPVVAAIEANPTLRRRFDFNAQGVIGLLVDFEDRIVPVDLGFKNLSVCRLSIEDWVVSKLASPKLMDVLNVDLVTADTIRWVSEHMHDYGGVSINAAHSDLQLLQREFG